MKKLKAILLVIDLLLAAAALATGLYCLDWWNAAASVPDAAQYEQKAAQLALDAAALDSKIQHKEEQIGALLADSENAYAAAEAGYTQVKANYDAAAAQRDDLQAQMDMINNADAVIKEKQEAIAQLRTDYGTAIRKLEDMILNGETDYRICYLTFDDGPSYLTPQFLDKLKKHDAYATFFTIGVSMKGAATKRNSYLKREAMEGHTIANHTYTHAFNGSLYKSTGNFMDAVRRQDELVYKVTGMHTNIVRCPAGSYYNPYRKSSLKALAEEGYEWMDWIGNAYDSGDNNYSAAQTARTVIYQVRHDKITVVLMHDWKQNTLDALDSIIPTLKQDNYLFLPLFKESSMNGNCVPKWDD